MIGRYEDDGFIVHTSANVGQFAGAHMAEMLTRAGARLNEQPVSTVDAELVELQVVEGGTYTGLARIRVIVSHGPNGPWAKIYEGKSRRWGRTHDQANFNEALSNALESATTKMLEDDEFAHAVLADAPPPPPGAGS